MSAKAVEPERGVAIRALMRRGMLAQALRLAMDWAAQCRQDVGAHMLLAELQLQAGFRDAALDSLRVVLELAPASFEPRVLLARILIGSGRRAEAAAEIEQAAKVTCTPAQHNTIGVLLTELQQHEKALLHLMQASATQPDSTQYAYNLATCLRMKGQMERAIAVCDDILVRSPPHTPTYYLRSDLRAATLADNRVSAMNRLLRDGALSWSDERNIRFALARECEDIGDYEQSFEHCRRGNELQRQNLRYDVANDIAVIDHIIATHTLDALAATRPGWRSERPIFILGLPRTGTTLTERVLGSHSDVHLAGEREEFTQALSLLGTRQRTAASASRMVDRVAGSLLLDLAELGRIYLDMLQAETRHAARFIDKQPLNYLYCGLISRALPGARIILVERNPMDSCYAIYKTLFGSAYPFSYDLLDLGRYYIAYRRLVAHWRSVLEDRLLIVRYEDVVADFDRQAERLIAFCGLEWQDACRDFYNNPVPSGTASAAQVRRPIYSSSVEKWRHYRKQLAPLAEQLQAAGIAIE